MKDLLVVLFLLIFLLSQLMLNALCTTIVFKSSDEYANTPDPINSFKINVYVYKYVYMFINSTAKQQCIILCLSKIL